MEYVLIATVILSAVLFVAFFRRSTQDAREEAQAACRVGSDYSDSWEAGGAASYEVLQRIFSQDDENFVVGESDPGTMGVFRRERKRLALRWIERRKLEASAAMRNHRQAARGAIDLRPSEEMMLLLRHAKLSLMCEVLAVTVWLAGPQSLHGLAERADEISRKAQRLRQAMRSRKDASA
jgi:hypothetical protein